MVPSRAICLLIVSIVCLASHSSAACAQNEDAVTESVITAAFPDRSISALVTHLARHRPFRRAILLMPGHPGIMRLQSADSPYGMKGNFLVRSRRFWLDEETVVLCVDAPSDRWTNFPVFFRSGPRYAEDIRGLIREIGRQFGDVALAIVGTSEGSISAYYAARALDRPDVKVIFSSSVFNDSQSSPGLANADFDAIKGPMLWVHHVDDPCPWTPYSEAKRLAGKTRSPLISVRSADRGRGAACQAFTQHGYAGVEKETVLAMKAWLIEGLARDVEKP